MEQAKLFEFMQKSDAFITPSLRDSGGMAALEALKCGCPVVAIALGGLNHSVKHGINGFLVQPSSVDEIEKNLAKYCQREKIKSLSSDAIIQSVRPFSRDALSEWTKELYSNILNSDNKR
jgi:glycosyltransferase involved in cell wall biosynthesis